MRARFRPGLPGPFGARWRARHPFRPVPGLPRRNPLAVATTLAAVMAIAIAAIATLGLALLFSRGRLRMWRGSFRRAVPPGPAGNRPAPAGGAAAGPFTESHPGEPRGDSFVEVIEMLPVALAGALPLGAAAPAPPP